MRPVVSMAMIRPVETWMTRWMTPMQAMRCAACQEVWTSRPSRCAQPDWALKVLSAHRDDEGGRGAAESGCVGSPCGEVEDRGESVMALLRPGALIRWRQLCVGAHRVVVVEVGAGFAAAGVGDRTDESFELAGDVRHKLAGERYEPALGLAEGEPALGHCKLLSGLGAVRIGVRSEAAGQEREVVRIQRRNLCAIRAGRAASVLVDAGAIIARVVSGVVAVPAGVTGQDLVGFGQVFGGDPRPHATRQSGAGTVRAVVVRWSGSVRDRRSSRWP